MIGIYKITSPTGKVYIGQSVDIKKRIRKYKYINECIEQRRLYNSLKKHGYDNHTIEVIQECEEKELDKTECFYIQKYDALGFNGLNCKDGGSRGRLSQETKDKISAYQRGKIVSDETKRKISVAHKGVAKPCSVYWKGKNHSNETRNKISKARKEMFSKMNADERKLVTGNKIGFRHSPETIEKLIETRKYMDFKRSKMVFDTYTGIFYKSITEAAYAKKILKSSLVAFLNKKVLNAMDLNCVKIIYCFSYFLFRALAEMLRLFYLVLNINYLYEKKIMI